MDKLNIIVVTILISFFALTATAGGISSGGDEPVAKFASFECFTPEKENSITQYAVTASSSRSYTDSIKMNVIDLSPNSSGFLLNEEEVQASLHFKDDKFELTYKSSKISITITLVQSKLTSIPNHYDAMVSTFTGSGKDLVNELVYCHPRVSQ